MDVLMDVAIAVKKMHGLKNVPRDRSEPNIAVELVTLNELIDRLPASFEHNVEGVTEFKSIVNICDIGVTEVSELFEFRNRVIAHLFISTERFQYLYREGISPRIRTLVLTREQKYQV